jgi:hypothetical protein
MWQRALFAQLLSLQIGNNNNTKLQIGFLVLNGCYCPFLFSHCLSKNSMLGGEMKYRNSACPSANKSKNFTHLQYFKFVSETFLAFRAEKVLS